MFAIHSAKMAPGRQGSGAAGCLEARATRAAAPPAALKSFLQQPLPNVPKKFAVNLWML
jgi:hypothetical protein